MKFSKLFTDERAVSPVIGVILMVAITVILAAVIGTFVLGLGNNLGDTAPNANFDFDYQENGNGTGYNVTATHGGGATIDTDNAGSLNLTAGGDAVEFNYPVQSGSSVTLNDSNANTGTPDQAVESGTDVRVIWTSQDGSNSQALGEGSTPS